MKTLIKYKPFILVLVVVLMLNLISSSSWFFVIDAKAQQQVNSFDTDIEAFVYSRNDRRDPFALLISKSGDIKREVHTQNEGMMQFVKDIKVAGIIWDEEMPLAMINNEIYKIGDVINQLTVKNITTESVVFDYFDLTHTITIIEKKDF